MRLLGATGAGDLNIELPRLSMRNLIVIGECLVFSPECCFERRAV